MTGVEGPYRARVLAGTRAMLNPRLDLAALRAEFARDGRIRVRDVLDPAVANAIAKRWPACPAKHSAPP